MESMRAFSRNNFRFFALTFVIASTLLVLTGCGGTPVGVWRLGGDRVFRDVSANALSEGVPSEYSTRVLARYNLLEVFDADSDRALARLHRLGEADPDRDHVFALAELSYLIARDRRSKMYYLASVVYAYIYLFGDRSAGSRDPYDPRFRVVADLYNRSLSEFLEARDGNAVLENGTHELPFGTMNIEVTRPGFPWGAEEFTRFVPALDFKVRGLRARYRNRGLGVPLIAIRNPPEDKDRRTADFLSVEAKVAATAFLRLPLKEMGVHAMNFTASLELYAPFNVPEVPVGDQRVPLEADLTAPLAYGLEEGKVWDFELGSFLSPGKASLKTGMFLVQPYSPGKIPLVFVHGTASSPARWAEMFNELQGYQDLRERYHAWFFVYSTGNPVSYSGSLLRDALHDVVKTLDPEGKDPALRKMVVIGHSQGGLLTKLQAIDSGDRFWSLIDADKKIEDLELSPSAQELLRKVCYFERVPSVSRVIFVSTPHGGSFMAGRWAGRLASSLVSLPGELVDVGQGLFRKNDDDVLEELDIPTSVQNMEPGNHWLVRLAETPIHPEVKSHSIIAVKGTGPITTGNDGVVEYSSAHIEGVESELVVFNGHSCQAHPETILEVRRILLEHLEEAGLPADAD